MFATVLLLAACGDDTAEEQQTKLEQSLETQPVEDLYNQALDALQQKEWKAAKEGFEEVERQHPYSKWSKRAQVMNAYANYQKQDYEEATAILDRFVRLYPGDEQAEYAYYLMALCYYEQISDVGRDQAMTRKALGALQDIIRRFPESDYARDAKVKLDLTVDHLAGKEMEVGRYYLKKDEYTAALKRFGKVLEEYQTTSHTAEALHRMVEIYLKLGVVNEAEKYAAVLGHNYRSSPWYKDSYKLLAADDK